MKEDIFSFVMPAQIEKSADGEWRIRGRASTESRDRQQEVILQNGIDLTPIDQKRGYFNADHGAGPENLIGVIDGYKRNTDGLYVEGRLFKNHTKAKAYYEIMSSLSKGDEGRVGLSIEGRVIERDAKNPKIIKKCQVKNVAVTLNPVNTDTYADLVKSLTAGEIEFDATEENATPRDTADQLTFTTAQVMELVAKALSIGGGGAEAPSTRSGGEALAMEEMDSKPKPATEELKAKRKKLKVMSKDLYKSHMNEMLDKICVLYPDYSKEVVWAAVKDRLSKKFPNVDENSN